MAGEQELIEFTLKVLVALGAGVGVLKATIWAINGREARQKTDYAVRSQGWSIIRFLDVFSKKKGGNGDQ